MYNKRYSGGGNLSQDQNQSQSIKDQSETMSLQNQFRSDLARIEAKIDILLNLAYSEGTHPSDPSSRSKVPQISPAELSLLRNMTAKQHVTAHLLIEGWSNKDIAHVLGIGENTVKLHVRAVCKKVGTKTRGQAALVFRDILENVDPSEYQRSSGGLPLDWGSTYVMGNKDPYENIYRKD